MSQRFSLLILAIFLSLSACSESSSDNQTQNPPPPPSIVESESDIPFVKATETAHKRGSFLSHPAVSMDLALTFGGRERFRGKMSMLTSTGKLRLDPEDGPTTIFDGKEVYQVMDSTDMVGSRFAVFTWTYFFALPYKLSDPGTIWNDYPNKDLGGKTYNAEKLTFEDGTGDSSKDWYIAYTDLQSNLIYCAPYIVTYSNSAEEAEEDPHAITYSDYREVDGIPMAHSWKFWAWRAEEGLTDELGFASLDNIEFIDEVGSMFDKPENGKALKYEFGE